MTFKILPLLIFISLGSFTLSAQEHTTTKEFVGSPGNDKIIELENNLDQQEKDLLAERAQIESIKPKTEANKTRLAEITELLSAVEAKRLLLENDRNVNRNTVEPY